MKYDSHWIKGLNAREKQNMEDLLGANNLVLDKLIEICYNMIRNSDIDNSDFETPNWALRQADKVGYRRALKQIVKLCTVKGDM
jgi:hypothetical protein